jgi:hypothetical protein
VYNQSKQNIDLASIAETWRSIPQVEVELTNEEDRLLVLVSGRPLQLRVVTRASGYPRDVREAVWQARERLGSQEQLLVAAPALTANSREWLQSQEIAYTDSQGSLFLIGEGVYIFREPLQGRPKSSTPVESNIFRGRATQVLHALLHLPEHEWHVTALASEAGVAPGTALKVCETLEKMLLMEREGRGPQSVRKLVNLGALLDAWAEKHRLDAYQSYRYYRWMSDLDDLASAIGKAVEKQRGPYAVTLTLGAMHRAPFVTQTEQVAILIEAGVDVNRLASDCQLKPAEEGYNVLLLSDRTATPFMYRQTLDNLWVADDIQLYLDLFASAGRGREQAEHLRRERLKF